MQAMTVLPPALPVAGPLDLLAALLGRLHETSVADQADRRVALDEARLARLDAATRGEAAGCSGLQRASRSPLPAGGPRPS